MPLPSTMTPIATITLSSASTITFSNIPQTYTDLVLMMSGLITTDGNSIILQFNGDTATNYSHTGLYGTGASASSNRTTNRSYAAINWNTGFSSSQQCNAIANIMNYANTSTFKTVLSRSNNTSGATLPGTEATVALWRSTSSITSIKIWDSVSTLASGFTATLYGIKAAS